MNDDPASPGQRFRTTIANDLQRFTCANANFRDGIRMCANVKRKSRRRNGERFDAVIRAQRF
jgi:hypothetical protein